MPIFVGILQALRHLERAQARTGFAKIAGSISCEIPAFDQRLKALLVKPGVLLPGGSSALARNPFPRSRPGRCSLAERSLAPGCENLVRQFAIPGNPGEQQRTG